MVEHSCNLSRKSFEYTFLFLFFGINFIRLCKIDKGREDDFSEFESNTIESDDNV